MKGLRVAALAFGLGLVVGGCGGGSRQTTPPPETHAPTKTTTTTTPVPPARPMSWDEAGAFVWHETDVSPEYLGREMRDNGFGWVAVFLHDGLTVDPVEADWVGRFRQASGLPIGGWGALRAHPVEEARLASSLVASYGLAFYVADAEADYAYSGPDGPDTRRFRRSREFAKAFRRLQPSLPVAISSYCRPDEHDIDWGAWSSTGFVFLPQAYVNDFGAAVSPATCVHAARLYFPAWNVHPTIGMYPGASRALHAETYARLLSQAGTVGFSVFLAETRMTPEAWTALGAAIRKRGLATDS